MEDVSTYVEEFAEKRNGSYGIRLQDLQIKIKCLNEKQKDLKNAIEQKDVVISTGPAGTGKTYLSLITALHLMKTQPIYTKLILVKSLQTIPGEDPGFLPGTIEDKMAPYLYSFTGNLDKIFGYGLATKSLMERKIIDIQPIAYIRGVTIDNAIVIMDEAQNIDMHTFKTIITRIGHNCKMIFLGDTEQVDRKLKSESCLSKVCDLFKDKEFTGSVTFTAEESVRNPIIPKLLEILK
jgi:phosphate starvation-inducible PhoH-like protein